MLIFAMTTSQGSVPLDRNAPVHINLHQQFAAGANVPEK
jgi:hypothetical protein